MAKRTSTITPAQDAAAALAAARKADTFKPAPSAGPARRRAHADSDTDLQLLAEEIFARDAAPDFDDDDAPDLSSVDDVDLDAIREEGPPGEVEAKHGPLTLRQHRNGRVVWTDALGVIRKVVKNPPRVAATGRFASVEDEQRVAAREQRRRYAHLPEAERVRRRIEGLGRSIFGGTGGFTSARRDAFIQGWKNDRERRGWRVPDDL